VIHELAGTLKPYPAMADDVIFREGDVGREMFILMEGQVLYVWTYLAPQHTL
jgi:hypothetical protein